MRVRKLLPLYCGTTHSFTGFLLFRVLKTGSDTRFDDIRSHFFKFLGFWVGQILWVWVVSLPVTILNSPGVTPSRASQSKFGTGTDIAGVVLWVVGWVIESLADIQKVRNLVAATGWPNLYVSTVPVQAVPSSERPANNYRHLEILQASPVFWRVSIIGVVLSKPYSDVLRYVGFCAGGVSG